MSLIRFDNDNPFPYNSSSEWKVSSVEFENSIKFLENSVIVNESSHIKVMMCSISTNELVLRMLRLLILLI
jgi:hypothetical protein